MKITCKEKHFMRRLSPTKTQHDQNLKIVTRSCLTDSWISVIVFYLSITQESLCISLFSLHLTNQPLILNSFENQLKCCYLPRSRLICFAVVLLNFCDPPPTMTLLRLSCSFLHSVNYAMERIITNIFFLLFIL